ncbi:MAG: hypothetical protein AB8G11_09580 [Saprospiraceae bacterium]
MSESKNRNGNFSSSAIYKLCSKGRGSLTLENVGASYTTYIKEKKREKKLKRGINSKAFTRPLIWGIICELYVFERKLNTSFSNMNNVGRLSHSEIENWTGIPDTFRKKELVVGDIKCPSSLIKFCDLIEDSKDGVEVFKKNTNEYYWQLVSNSILTGVSKAELLFYVPYLSELEQIRDFVEGLDENDLPIDMELHQIQWIANEINAYVAFGKKPISIPYLPDDSDYKDFNQFVFDIPKEDEVFLTERVKMAVAELKK